MNTQHSSMAPSSLQQMIMKASFATSSDKQSALDLAGELQREADELTAARQYLKHEARYLTRIAELERVQSVLVGAASEMIHNDGSLGTYSALKLFSAREKLGAALAAAQKPASTTAPLNVPALLRQCAELAKWRYCMSYDDSYFGEPAGDLKRIAAEIDRLIPVGLHRETQTQDDSGESNFRRMSPEVEAAIDRAAQKPEGGSA